MQHQIPVAELGPHGEGMARAVTTCVHCGFCLPACPTYRVLGEEMDSPRGRILLMKQALEGTLSVGDVLPYIDRCLGCLACETACPSGVHYRDLVVPFRAKAEEHTRSIRDRVVRRARLAVLESPGRFRLALAAGRLARLVSPLAPRAVRDMLAFVPPREPPSSPLPEHVAASGRRRARIALLAGCVQDVLRPSINRAVLRVLAANGVEVVVPSGQRCCGALALHAGVERRAMALADHNRAVFPADVDAIVTTAAGCGSAMKEQAYRAPVKDVAEFLDALGLTTPLAFGARTSIAYHDACHLGHGQGVRAAPRRLLATIRNAALLELADGEMCCGSAGLYNLEHPGTAAALGLRKAAAIRATGAQIVATGNIGCLAQIEAHLAGDGGSLAVRHTLEVLDSAL